MTPVTGDVPAYKVERFVPRRKRYAVCVFILNEGPRIRRQLQKMAPLAEQFDLIIADGGSTDNGVERRYLQDHGVHALLTKTGPGALSAQMRMAFAYTMNEGYSGVIVIDGNDKDDPAAIPEFGRLLNEGFDHVQGSRFIPGGVHRHTPLSRLLAVRLLHAPVMSLAAGFRYTDTTNGFRAYSRKLLLDPRVQPFRSVFNKYELHYYLAIRAARLGFKVIETPVTRVYPKGEKTPTKIKGLRGNSLILQTLARACRGDFNPSAMETPAPMRQAG